MSSFWTAERDAELLKWWPTNSASKIAQKLGTTRNAVIGRVHRLQRRQKNTPFPYKAREAAERKARREAKEAVVRGRDQKIVEMMKGALGNGASRDQAIVLALKKGASWRAIGEAIGVTRERIRQIVAKVA